MPKKAKKPSKLAKLLQSSQLRAFSVVVLVVAAGAIILPNIFAATRPVMPFVNSLSATPTNTASYAVTLKWNGYTTHHFTVKSFKGSQLLNTWWTPDKTFGIQNLQCGVTHTFKVAPAKEGGGFEGEQQSVNATVPCPQVNLTGLTANGTSVTATWAKVNFAERYTIYMKGGNEGYSGVTTTNTSRTISGRCGTTYYAYVTATANNQTGSGSTVRSVTTASCTPTPPPPNNPPPSNPQPPTTGGGGGGTTSSGGSSTPSSGGSTSSGGSRSSSSGSRSTGGGTTSTPAKAGPPAAPENFAATVRSNKVVVLTWDASGGADHYLINRSTDNQNWQEIANTTSTSYEDEDANFETTYYYQLQAVGSDGQVSGTVTAQVATEAFEASSSTITSQDKLVSITIPDGAIDGEYNCTLSASEEASDIPKGQNTLLGPYDLLCVTADGVIIDSFTKSLSVTMKLASVVKGYEDINVQAYGDNGWTPVEAKFDPEKQEVSFSLASAKSFAAFGVKPSSIWGVVLTIFLIIAAIVGGIFGFRWWRNRTPSQYQAVMAQNTAEQEFKEALAHPDCTHLSMAQQVVPSSNGCYECEQQGTKWSSLRICLSCGHVGCSDDSLEQHALKHYQQTGHPLIYEYGNPNGNTIGWCYIDQTYI